MKRTSRKRYSFASERQRPLARAALFHSLSPEARQGIGVVCVLMLFLLSAVSLIGLAGTVGAALDSAFGLLFGSTKYGVPLFFLIGGMFFVRRVPLANHFIQGVGLFFFILSFTAFWHLSYPIEESYAAASEGLGGGLIGFFLAYSLQTVLQFWGALIVLIAIFLASFCILLNASLADVTARIAAVGALLYRWGAWLGMRMRTMMRARGRDDVHLDDDEKHHAPPVFSRDTLSLKEQESHSEETVREAHKEEIEILKTPKRKAHSQIPLALLNGKQTQPTSGDIKANKLIIQKTLENFGIPVEMGEVNVGPTVTQFTLKPAEGIKLAAIIGLHNDLALALASHPIRIEAPIPGKALVGIEVPNQKVATVTLRELLESEQFRKRKNSLELVFGKDVSGTPRTASLLSMPHLLIAGATGSGKTVCINAIITTLLFQNSPETLRFILIDPKRVELPCYNDIPHLLTPVVTDVKKTLNALRWAIGEMERRFDILAKSGKRDVRSYNEQNEEKLPYIVIVVDELADIMATVGVEAETLIIRLAQMARAVGIHLVLATQRPSVDVITGLIKANITSRIAFAVASQMDSRTILDTSGAERLVGRGDMLFISADISKPLRLQGAYLSDEEIERVVSFLKAQGEPSYHEGVVEKQQTVNSNGFVSDGEEDDLLPEAREIILQSQKASASLLQRRLRIGYARAARILDLLEAEGFIGPGDGAKPRRILAGQETNFDSERTIDEDSVY